MLVIVCYDVSDDKRRTRLHKTLEGFGQAVQWSVFECDLTWEQYRRMRERVEKVVRRGEDRVRFFLLCQACAARTEVLGGPPVERAPQYYVV